MEKDNKLLDFIIKYILYIIEFFNKIMKYKFKFK